MPRDLSSRRSGWLAALGFTLAAGAFASACTSSAGSTAGSELVSVTGPELVERVRGMDARYVVVNVWATWCGPCREEFPYIQSVTRTFADEGVELVFVSADFDTERAAALDFLESHGADLPSYIKTGDDGAFIDALAPEWSGSIPFTVIFDDDGRRVKMWRGQVEEEDLRTTLKNLVSASAG